MKELAWGLPWSLPKVTERGDRTEETGSYRYFSDLESCWKYTVKIYCEIYTVYCEIYCIYCENTQYNNSLEMSKKGERKTVLWSKRWKCISPKAPARPQSQSQILLTLGNLWQYSGFKSIRTIVGFGYVT